MDLDHYDRETGDSRVTYECRNLVPEGDYITFTGEQKTRIDIMHTHSATLLI